MAASDYTRSVLASFTEVNDFVKRDSVIELDGYCLRLSDTVAICEYVLHQVDLIHH